MPEIAPYGSWLSPLDPEVLAGRGVRLGFPSYAPDGALCWVEFRPSEGGRAVPVRRAEDGSALDLLPPPHGARTRVHEYGGRTLAFLAWNHPAMPWDAAELWVAHLSNAGQVERLERVAGGEEGSAFQPAWSPDGTLLFALEVGDAWALCAQRGGRVERVVELDGELGAPLWQLGTELFGFAGPHTVVAACFRQGLSRVHRVDLRSGRAELLTDALAHVGQLACGAGRVALLVGSAGLGSRLVEMDVFTGRAELVRDAHAGMLDPDDVSHPEPVTFPTGDGEASHGFFYRPRNRLFAGPEGARPPLVVLAHGGPTGCATATFNPAVQFWTTRGFAVLDVNYRGSTGYGRA